MKVTTYEGHDVPEGATHYHKGNSGDITFYKMRKGEVEAYKEFQFEWVFCPNGEHFTDSICLPEQPDLDIKWEDAPTDTAVWIQDDNAENGNDFSGWYEEVEDRYIECAHSNFLRKSDMCYTVHHHPEQPEPEVNAPDKAEWMPEVGEECEVKELKSVEWDKCLVMGEFEGLYWVTVHHDTSPKSGSHCTIYSNLVEFRPLKTAEEKKREAFIDSAYELTMSTDPKLKQVFTTMYECGFTAPEGK